MSFFYYPLNAICDFLSQHKSISMFLESCFKFQFKNVSLNENSFRAFTSVNQFNHRWLVSICSGCHSSVVKDSDSRNGDKRSYEAFVNLELVKDHICQRCKMSGDASNEKLADWLQSGIVSFPLRFVINLPNLTIERI